MMNRGAQLLELQEIENDLRDKITEYKKVQYLLSEPTRVRQARERFEEAEAAEREARRRQQEINLEWQGVLEKVEQEEKSLYSGDITNPKELSNLQLEVEMLKKQREKLEEQAIALVEEVEQRSQETETAKQEYEKVEQEALQRRGDLEKKENALKRYITGRRRLRSQLMEEVDSVSLEQYRYVQRLKNDTFAVATLNDGVCSACHIQVSNAKRDTVERTDKEKLVTCGNCGRILVF